jgi:erythronate-4-phosphate dehydrogenase
MNPPFSLSDKKVGIIGYGHVGSRVKRFMDIFGVRCILNDPPLCDQTNNKSFADLEQVLQSDIITLHVPLTKEGTYPTYNLVDSKFLERLKSDVFFINTSRGEVIDEQALLSFKKRNPESTLILDVWRNEPDINVSLLEQAFIATPHIAGYSYEAKLRATEMLFDSLNNFLKTDFDCSEFANYKSIALIPENNNSDYLIEFIISQHWNILEDNISFQHYSSLASDKRPMFYDNLRKNYPIRYEFTSRIIDMHKCADSNIFSDEVKKNLKKLGFKFKNA